MSTPMQKRFQKDSEQLRSSQDNLSELEELAGTMNSPGWKLFEKRLDEAIRNTEHQCAREGMPPEYSSGRLSALDELRALRERTELSIVELRATIKPLEKSVHQLSPYKE